jgi:hypothetical protein
MQTTHLMINATLALLGCVGGDWMSLGGVARRERRAERSAAVGNG